MEPIPPACAARAATVAALPGLIAFWDFREDDGGPWWSRRDPATAERSYPMRLRRIGDPRAYDPRDWPVRDGRGALQLSAGGPFGRALACDQGHVYGEVARADFDGGALDLRGRRPFTLLAWARFTGARHLVAGIWDEGGWDRYGGRRQVALFGGLFGSRGVIAHISATGAASFPQSSVPGAQYARIKAIDGGAFADGQWVCLGMTWDPASGLLTAYQDGVATPRDYRDEVAAAVFGVDAPQPVNPIVFRHPVYGPRGFLVKFNGYGREGGVAEHRLQVDLDAGTIAYDRTPVVADGTWQVRCALERDGAELPGSAAVAAAEPGRTATAHGLAQARSGDVLLAGLWRQEDGGWRQVGATVRRSLRDGAPFTVGRALGLGAEEVAHGSQLQLGGVAAVARVLVAAELRAIAFAP